MTAILLNGASSPADQAYALCTELERQLAAQFDTGRGSRLAGFDIGHGTGEFDCYVKTPGRCRSQDSPFFRKAGETTHHAVRCAHRAPWAAVALDKTPSSERTRWFQAFAETNMANVGRPARRSDLLLIIGPLYWDSLPCPGLLAREHIHAARLQSGASPARRVGRRRTGDHAAPRRLLARSADEHQHRAAILVLLGRLRRLPRRTP